MKKLLLIGWDGADWDVINPLIDTGKMPNLKHLIDHGVVGDLATLYPELSPMLWTSIATGKRAYKHGIYGFTEVRPDGQGIRPISNLSRKTKAIWNILNQNNLSCHVIGWWPSHPVEPVNGVMVSNFYPGPYAALDPKKEWSLVEGSVYPKRIEKNLSVLRWHPQKLSTNHILPFVPNIGMIDQENDHRLESIAKTICESGSIKEAAVAIMHHEPWDFAAVYFVGIDHFSHGFMNYHPPLLPWVSKQDFEIFQNVINSAYIFHDILLGQLLEETNDDTTIILISDHGFQSGQLRPRHIPSEPAGPAAQHRKYGILVMKGPQIKSDDIIFGPNLLDICPTILSIFDLPVAEDMDGKPLMDAFQTTPTIKTIDSWDNLAGDSRMHASTVQLDPFLSNQIMNQLVDLGYIEKPPENTQTAIKETIREQDYNLARVYIDTNMHMAAIKILEPLYEEWPDESRFGLRLIDCYIAINRISRARKTFDHLLERKKQTVLKSKEALEKLQEEYQHKNQKDIPKDLMQKIYQLQRKSGMNDTVAEYLEGSISFAEKNYKKALTHLQRSENMGYINPDLYLKIGNSYHQLNQIQKARSCYNRTLELDSNNAGAFLGLSQCFLSENEYEGAAQKALTGIGYQYYFPRAHYTLAVALHKLERIESAIEALETALSQNPQFPEAYELMATIYMKHKNDHQKAETFLKEAAQSREHIEKIKHAPFSINIQKPPERQGKELSSFFELNDLPQKPFTRAHLSETIVVVTGLPRSGTSMIMQMLQAGGLPLLFDNKRPEDHNNPKGYFEFEPSKQIARNNRFLEKAKGKGIKIIPQLLKYMNQQLSYRIIFIIRDLDEVIVSQQAMLKQNEKKGADMSSEALKSAYLKQLEHIQDFLSNIVKIPVYFISHQLCIEKPYDAANHLNTFMGGILDVDKMANVVSKKLYRQRIAKV